MPVSATTHRTTSTHILSVPKCTGDYERGCPAPQAAQPSLPWRKLYHSPTKIIFNPHREPHPPHPKSKPYLEVAWSHRADLLHMPPHPPHHQTSFPNPTLTFYPSPTQPASPALVTGWNHVTWVCSSPWALPASAGSTNHGLGTARSFQTWLSKSIDAGTECVWLSQASGCEKLCKKSLRNTYPTTISSSECEKLCERSLRNRHPTAVFTTGLSETQMEQI